MRVTQPYPSAILYQFGAIQKGRPTDPGGGRVCGIRTFNCYSSVILLFYPDAGGRGVQKSWFQPDVLCEWPFQDLLGTIENLKCRGKGNGKCEEYSKTYLRRTCSNTQLMLTKSFAPTAFQANLYEISIRWKPVRTDKYSYPEVIIVRYNVNRVEFIFMYLDFCEFTVFSTLSDLFYDQIFIFTQSNKLFFAP